MRSRERGVWCAEIVYDDGFEESRWAWYQQRVKPYSRSFRSMEEDTAWFLSALDRHLGPHRWLVGASGIIADGHRLGQCSTRPFRQSRKKALPSTPKAWPSARSINGVLPSAAGSAAICSGVQADCRK